MEIQGKIHSIGKTQKISDSFSKREFVIETEEQYKQYVLVQLVKDKCDVLNQYKVGDNVTASLNIKGRLWTNPQGEEKCFNTWECWKLSKNTDAANIEVHDATPVKEEESDLPF